jgi:hypothetical protein
MPQLSYLEMMTGVQFQITMFGDEFQLLSLMIDDLVLIDTVCRALKYGIVFIQLDDGRLFLLNVDFIFLVHLRSLFDDIGIMGIL